MSAVFIWNIADTFLSEEQLPSWLEEGERCRISRIREGREKRQRIGALLLLGALVGRHFGDTKAGILHDAHGRPIVSGHPDLSCSVSHSGDYVMCGTACSRDGMGLGVDIERALSAEWRELGRIFAGREKEALEHCTKEKRAEYLSYLWVCKEAYLKALGLGFSVPPSQIVLEIDLSDSPAGVSISVSPFEKQVSWQTGRIGAFYYAVCSPAGDPVPQVRVIDSLNAV